MSHAYDPVDDEPLDDTLPLDEVDEGLEDDADGEADPPPVSGEDRARAMGWKPRAEYRGDPRRWTDWPEFLQKGEEELPILRDQNRRMSERLARLEPQVETLRQTVSEQAAAIKRAESTAQRADEAGYQRALRELKDQQRAAVREGDEETYDAVQEQIDAMEAKRAETQAPAPAPAEASPPNGRDPAIEAFVAANAQWFNDTTRPYLRAGIIANHNVIIQENNAKGLGLSVAQQLERAKARLVRDYPDDFPREHRATPPPAEEDDEEIEEVADPAPRRQAPARRTAGVLAPSGAPLGEGQGRRRPADPFDRLDPADRADARAAYLRARANDPKMPASEYVELVLNPHADALELRHKRKP
jgi:hypothetical protein